MKRIVQPPSGLLPKRWMKSQLQNDFGGGGQSYGARCREQQTPQGVMVFGQTHNMNVS